MTTLFLIQAFMLVVFWLIVAYAATFTINCSPTFIVNDKSHFEILFPKVSNYYFLKAFNCFCFLNFVATLTNKLSPFSVYCAFLGYASKYK